jgi:hypothetical protein
VIHQFSLAMGSVDVAGDDERMTGKAAEQSVGERAESGVSKKVKVKRGSPSGPGVSH